MQQPTQMPQVLRDPAPQQADNAPVAGDSTTRRGGLNRRALLKWLPWGLFVGVLVIVVVVWAVRRPVPALTAESLAQARTRWREQRAVNYEFRLRVGATGLAPATYHAIVQEGKLVQLSVDGEPASSGAPADYTIDGLFNVLEQEFGLQEASGPEASRQGRPVVRARFDPITGIPVHFLRMVPGTNRSTEWHVIEFRTPAEGEEPASRTTSALSPNGRPIASASWCIDTRFVRDGLRAQVVPGHLGRGCSGAGPCL